MTKQVRQAITPTHILGSTGTAEGDDLGFQSKADFVVGTVSESGGVPTGAIIERGSNANGEFVRFADGTQIATKAVTLANPTGNSTQEYSAPVVFIANTLTAMFVSALVNPSAPETRVLGPAAVGFRNSPQADPRFYIRWDAGFFLPDETADLKVVFTAIGRWF